MGTSHEANGGHRRQVAGVGGEWWASEANGGHQRQVVVLVTGGCWVLGQKWFAMGLSSGQ